MEVETAPDSSADNNCRLPEQSETSIKSNNGTSEICNGEVSDSKQSEENITSSNGLSTPDASKGSYIWYINESVFVHMPPNLNLTNFHNSKWNLQIST